MGAGGEGGPGGAGGDGGAGGAGGDGGAGGGGPVFASRKANVRFKRGARIQRELSRVLALPASDLCAELGMFDCFQQIHTITLGGVEPYNANIYEAFEATSVSAPLVVERVALAACATRVDADLAAPDEAVIWGSLGVAPDGRLDGNRGPGARASLEALFTRALLRLPETDDLVDLYDLYDAVEASGESEQPARDWAVLACMAVLTSAEALFY